MTEQNNTPKRSSESADLLRMLHLLRRLQRALKIEEPMTIENLDALRTACQSTREELLRLKTPDAARICDYLSRYLEIRRKELNGGP